jgi:hypothetical protein
MAHGQRILKNSKSRPFTLQSRNDRTELFVEFATDDRYRVAAAVTEIKTSEGP